MSRTIKCDTIINGSEYKQVVWINENGGSVRWKLQPKNIDPSVCISGPDIFVDDWTKDHFDYFYGGSK